MNIIHVEDHPLFSEGLEQLLATRFPHINVTRVSDLESLRARIDHHVDLILFDLYLPEMNGIKMMREIRAGNGAIPIAFLSSAEETADIKLCIQEGAMGFIPKALSGADIVSAIAGILEGERFLTRQHQQAISALSESNHADIVKKYAISYKQLDVLKAMSQGLSNSEIADQLGVSESAVKYHIGILFQSFCAKNRVECLRYAEQIGLLTAQTA